MMNRLFDVRSWQALLQSDFNRGYIAALFLVLALVLALLILKLLFMLAFRTRSCATVTVPRKDGDIVVSRDAVTEAVIRELQSFPALAVRKIRLYRRRRRYLMTIFCGFNGDGGVPQLVEELKPRLTETLKSTFGIDSLDTIKVVIERLDVDAAPNIPDTLPVSPFHHAAGTGL